MPSSKRSDDYYLQRDGVVFTCKTEEELEELKKELDEEKAKLIEYYSRKFINSKI